MLNSIRREPGISRAAISRLTAFPRTSVTYVVNRLIQKGLVVEKKVSGGAQAGRPPTALYLAAGAMMAIGVEISKPHSQIVLMDLNGETMRRQIVPWRDPPAMLLDDVERAVRAVAARYSRQILGVGVSLPGTIDKAAGRVVAAEGIGWFGVEVGTHLRAQSKWPLIFENDANVCALGEQWFGGPETAALRHFVYLQTQGGLGTGAVVDGRILHGISSAGIEFGHVMLDPEGLRCNCGNRGCWEQYASDVAMVRVYRELGGEVRGPEKASEDAIEIVSRAGQGDDLALKALRKTAAALGLGLVNMVAVLNPEAIIFGEPFACAWPLIEQVVWDEMRRRVPAYHLQGLRLLPSRAGADAILRGAAALVLSRFFTEFDHGDGDSDSQASSMVAHR